MTDKIFTLPASVGLVLRKDDKLLLIRRACTGYGDGCYACAGGKLDGNEPVTQTAIREAREELGIAVRPEDMTVLHAVHVRRQKDGVESICFFMGVTAWEGEPQNCEPHKCDDIGWFTLNDLPKNMLPTHAHVIGMIRRGQFYSEFGWD